MARTGRKRKTGARYPSGRLREGPPDYLVLAAQQPHRRDLPKDRRLDPDVTELGKLKSRNIITQPEYLAGLEFARITALYYATINPPRGLVGAGGGFQCIPEDCRLEDAPRCICADRRAAYMGVHDVVARLGHRVIVAVKRLVIEDRPLESERLLAIYGLMALARHLRLTERGKAANYRNLY